MCCYSWRNHQACLLCRFFALLLSNKTKSKKPTSPLRNACLGFYKEEFCNVSRCESEVLEEQTHELTLTEIEAQKIKISKQPPSSQWPQPLIDSRLILIDFIPAQAYSYMKVIEFQFEKRALHVYSIQQTTLAGLRTTLYMYAHICSCRTTCRHAQSLSISTLRRIYTYR